MQIKTTQAKKMLDSWASVISHRERYGYTRFEVQAKKARWEEPEKIAVGQAHCPSDYGTVPTRDAITGKSYFTTNGEEVVPVEYNTKSRVFKVGEAHPVHDDYLMVEYVLMQMGFVNLAHQRVSLLLLDTYPRNGTYAGEVRGIQEGHDWIMHGYTGKNPSRDYFRRCREFVKRIEKEIQCRVNDEKE